MLTHILSTVGRAAVLTFTVQAILAGAMMLALASSVQAESGEWTGNSSNVWQLNANWTGISFPSSRFQYATFNGAGNGNTTIDVGAGLIIEGVAFDSASVAAYTIGSGGVGAQTLSAFNGRPNIFRLNSSVANNQLFNANVQLGSSSASPLSVVQDSVTNTLTFAGGVWGGGASGANSLAIYGAGNTLVSGIIANNNGAGTATLALTKTDAGTLTLTNNNTYSGLTRVNGGTLSLHRQTGSLNSSSALTFGGTGKFNLDNVGAGGALSQNLGALTFSAGEGTVQTTRTAAFDEAIVFSSLAARTAGATGNFVNGGGVNGISNGFVLTGKAAGFIDKGIFYGGADYASMDALGTFVRALAYGSDTSAAAVNTITASNHIKLTATPANQNTITLLSLNLTGGGVNWMQNAAQTLTVPGILKSGGGATSTISGGAAVAAGAELVIRTDTIADQLTMNTPITGTALTKSGAGTLTFNVANSYTGTTTVNAGTLAYGVNDAIAAGAVIVNGGTLALGTFTDTVGAVTLTAGSITGSGTLTATSYTMNNPGSTSVSAVLAGAGGLIKSELGTLTLSNPNNTYTGATQIGNATEGGVLVVTSLKNGGLPSSIGASTSAAANLYFRATDGRATATLRYVGTGDSTDRLIKVDGYGRAVIDSSGAGALNFTNTGSADMTGGTNFPIWVELSGSNVDDNTFSLIIPHAKTGTSFVKSGAGKWILTGLNTYTGTTDVFRPYQGTTMIRGGTLSVSLLANGGLPSNIGASNNAAGQLVLDGGTLQYTGSGATTGTTNRLFTLGQGAMAGGLDASGASGSPLVFNNTGALAFSGSGDRTLTLAGTNTDANTLAPIVGVGSGGLTSLAKSGTGRWILSANNTYTGTTTISDGTLSASKIVVSGGNSNLGNATSAVVLGGATTAGTLSYTGVAADYTRGFTVNAGGGQLTNTTGNLLQMSTGGVSVASGGTFTLAANGTGGITLNPSSVVSGLGGVEVNSAGSGIAILSGNNTYSGNTTVTNGTLRVGSILNVIPNGSGKGNVVLHGGALAAGTLDLNDVSETINGLDGTSNAVLGQIVNNGSAALRTLTVGDGDAIGSFAGLIKNNTSGTGTVALTKIGGGTQTLSGANTYTGATNVNAGTLLVNGNQATATGLVTVASGATLGGYGTIGGNTVIHGIHSPGNSPGIQTFAGNLTYDANPNPPTVLWELIEDTVTNQPNPNALFDTVEVGGNLTFLDPTTLDLDFDNASSVLWSDTFWDVSHTGTGGWLMYDVAGTITGFPANLSINATNWLDSGAFAFNAARPGSSFSLSQEDNDIYLNYNVAAQLVPEPGTFVLAALGLVAIGLIAWRRQGADGCSCGGSANARVGRKIA